METASVKNRLADNSCNRPRPNIVILLVDELGFETLFADLIPVEKQLVAVVVVDNNRLHVRDCIVREHIFQR